MTNPKQQIELSGIRNITISGRLATGKSTLARHVGEILGWKILDGGAIIREYMHANQISIKDTLKRPDEFDLDFEKSIEELLKKESQHIVQAHLSGFSARGIDGVYKILVVCNDEAGADKQSIRIDRIMNRDLISAKQARLEVSQREEENLIKYRRLYANNDPNWVYWDLKYYDLIVNTFSLNQSEAANFVMKHLKPYLKK